MDDGETRHEKRLKGKMEKRKLQTVMRPRYWMLGASALGRPRGMVWGGRREEGSGWGTHVYLWWIHFDIWQNQYNIVKLKNKIKNNLKRSIYEFPSYVFDLVHFMYKSLIFLICSLRFGQ